MTQETIFMKNRDIFLDKLEIAFSKGYEIGIERKNGDALSLSPNENNISIRIEDRESFMSIFISSIQLRTFLQIDYKDISEIEIDYITIWSSN